MEREEFHTSNEEELRECIRKIVAEKCYNIIFTEVVKRFDFLFVKSRERKEGEPPMTEEDIMSWVDKILVYKKSGVVSIYQDDNSTRISIN